MKKTAYSCQECGAIHFKWSGRCKDCGSWNSLVEEYAEGGASSHFSRISDNNQKKSSAKKIELVELDGQTQEFARIKTSIGELDRVLGGGLVQGSVALIGGNPGIGKSTLLIQTANLLAQENCEVIYVSGEESIDQVRLRAKRLGLGNKAIKLAATTNVNDIVNSLADKKSNKKKSGGVLSGLNDNEEKKDNKNSENHKNKVVIIDSIQTMFLEDLSSAPGSVAQVRAAASELTVFAKKNNITLLIVSHVTKDGQIAGPKVLEHIVDTVLYFEGEKDLHFRILRAVKNRFGAAGEIGVFEMNDLGLSEVDNPSEIFLANYDRDTSGTSVFAGIEGTRPILVEVQALIAPSYMPSPRRAVVGWDSSRLAMIIAVLGSRFGLNLSDKEVYLNIVGGIEVKETAADLAIAGALISAARDLAIPSSTILIGEIGLTGEVRMISNLEDRLKEAEKLGFENCIIPKANEKNKNFKALKNNLKKINIKTISHVRDLAKVLF